MEYKLITELAYTYIGLVTTMTKHYVEDGVPLIFNSSIKVSGIDTSKPTFLDEEFAEKNKNRMHKKDDVVTVHTGDIGVSAVISDSLDGSLGFATIVTRINDQSILLPEYLCTFLNYGGGKEQLYKYSRDARNNLNLADYNKLIVPLPEINQQREIVDLVGRLKNIISNREQELKELDNLIKSRFVEMFGDPVAIIEDGRYEEIQNVTSEINVGFVGESVNEYVERGVPYLRMQNIRPLKIVDDSLIYINEKFHERIKNANVYTNDVVISRVGINRGMTAVIPEKYNNSSIGNAVIVRADRRFNSVFLAAFITFVFGKHTLIGYSKGSAQGAISVSLVKKWPIPFADIQKQNEFAEFVNQVDKLKFEVQKSLDETQFLMDSLMQEYFG